MLLFLLSPVMMRTPIVAAHIPAAIFHLAADGLLFVR